MMSETYFVWTFSKKEMKQGAKIVHDSQINYATEEEARIGAKALLDRKCGTLVGFLHYHEDTGDINSVKIIEKFGEVGENVAYYES